MWETRKELLGWMFNGHTQCIELPVGKVATISKLINQTVATRSVQQRDFEKLLRKVRHAAMGVPGCGGLFTPLNMALKQQTRWVRILADVKEALKDFRLLLNTAAAEPTHVHKLFPGTPAYVGYCGACCMGAGGVWVSGTKPV